MSFLNPDLGALYKKGVKMLKDEAKKIEDANRRLAAEQYIGQLVDGQYRELEATAKNADQELPTAIALEHSLHEQAKLLIEQAKLDGHGIITEPEVHHIIVMIIRNIKMTICEFDGEVSSDDHKEIAKLANGLTRKVTARWLSIQMSQQPKSIVERLHALDVVEGGVVTEVVSSVPSDQRVLRMRLFQAVIEAVANLRLQQLAKVAA